MSSPSSSKDTIYVDIDDEITTVIDKVRSSSGRVVALVLPKRATVFQSVVNMKLLKRNAESAKKHLVLVTTEAGLLPLAGAVGLHVAATPQSKPEIPSAGSPAAEAEAIADEDTSDAAGEAYTAANAGDRPIGELAGFDGTAQEVETLRLPEDEPPAAEAAESAKRPGKDKRLKVPNFNRFRIRLLLGGLLLVGAVVGLYFCLVVLPKAVIVVSTKTSSVNVNLTAVLNPSAPALDTSKSILPAKIEQQQKTTTQQATTTGEKNNGVAATGTVTLSACETTLSFPDPVPAGTGLSVNGLTFITQDVTKFSHSGIVNNGTCFVYQPTSDTSVAAQNVGAKYNVSSVSFTVAGRSDVSGTGTAAGGTDNIIHIVAQADIDNAKQKLAATDSTAVKTSLEQALRQEGKYPVPATFASSKPIVTTSNNAGDQADTVTVTQSVTYTMYGVGRNDLETLVKANITNQIDTQGQSIVNNGLDAATIAVTDTSGSVEHISLQTAATVGPVIDPAVIKKQVAGKKIGDVKAYINGLPGVTSVDVRLSPFWVSSVPTNLSKITVTVLGAKRT
jgi:hypothetical protein